MMAPNLSGKLDACCGSDSVIFLYQGEARSAQKVRHIATTHRDSFAKHFKKGWTHYRTATLHPGGKVTNESPAIPF